MKKKVCIITAARSEYGLLRWLIDEVSNDKNLELQLVVTGTHMSKEFGYTYQEIEEDGYQITKKVNVPLYVSTQKGIVQTMGRYSVEFAETFESLKPDIVVVLGDRYELLPICSAALIFDIPIAHISGGDVTTGAIDNQVRNAVTMMASIHFPGVKDSADRIIQMIGKRDNVFVVGELGLDNFRRLKLWDRKKLANELSLNYTKKWVLMTYHPETKITIEKNIFAVKNIITALEKTEEIQVIITGANADFGGKQINKILNNITIRNASKFKFLETLGQLRYLSLMKEVNYVIGNSSSGIVEAPFLAKPVINIGNRQKGRYYSRNIINSANDLKSITNSIKQINELKVTSDKYFGDGNTSIRITKILKRLLIDI